MTLMLPPTISAGVDDFDLIGGRRVVKIVSRVGRQRDGQAVRGGKESATKEFKIVTELPFFTTM